MSVQDVTYVLKFSTNPSAVRITTMALAGGRFLSAILLAILCIHTAGAAVVISELMYNPRQGDAYEYIGTLFFLLLASTIIIPFFQILWVMTHNTDITL